MSIVVTGATGHLGHLVVESLLERGVAPDEVLATGRSLGPTADLAARGVRTAVLDYAEPPAGLLEPGDTLLLVSTDVPGNRVALHGNVVGAAAKAGVGRIVYTSAPKADDTPLALAVDHAATERVIRASGLPFTILRNNWYVENYARTVAQARETGVILGSAGSGRVASAPRADFAFAAAVALSTDGHEDAVYELSGDEAWTFAEFAAALSTVLGRDVDYRSVSPAEHRAVLLGTGLDEGTADFVVGLDAAIAAGALDLVRPDLSRLAGRPTTPLAGQLRLLG